MPEISKEMRGEILRELMGDNARMQELIARVLPGQGYQELEYQHLEHLAYITEQMRLKLRVLGAPRIN